MNPSNLPPNCFNAEVVVPRRDPDGKVVQTKPLGHFIFKAPTLQDRLNIGLARARMLQGMGPNAVGGDTLFYADMIATLGAVVQESPDGWKTSEEIAKQLDDQEVQAVYVAYTNGLERFLSEAR